MGGAEGVSRLSQLVEESQTELDPTSQHRILLSVLWAATQQNSIVDPPAGQDPSAARSLQLLPSSLPGTLRLKTLEDVSDVGFTISADA